MADMARRAIDRSKQLTAELRRANEQLRRERKECQRLRRLLDARPPKPPARAAGVQAGDPIAALIRRAARKAAPAEAFSAMLTPPDAEGCRFFCDGVPEAVDIGGGRAPPLLAAMAFAGKVIPPRFVIERTCWNDGCFAAAHLNATPAQWRDARSAVVQPELLERVGALVAERVGIARGDLAGRAVFGRPGRADPVTSFVRQLFRYLLCAELGFSATAVCRALGCDRKTIRHGNRLIEDRRDDAAFNGLMDDLGRLARVCLACAATS